MYRSLSSRPNGIVENYQSLKKKLSADHHTFLSTTDTEVIAHLIEEELKNKKFPQAVFAAFNQLAGSNAIVVVDLHSHTVVACRRGSPLVIGLGLKQFFLASDVTAFLKYTRKVGYINDDEAVVITPKTSYLYDLIGGKKIKLNTKDLDLKDEDTQKNGYPHFLLKEINEQKQSIPKTALLNEKEILSIAQMIKQGYRVVLTACGTGAHCAMAAKYFFSQVGIETQVYGAYEFAPFAQFYGPHTICIAISQSGETADTLIAAKAAKAHGAHLVAVVNARASTLERLADTVLSVGSGPEIAVVSTKAYSAQLATLYLLAQAAADHLTTAQKRITDLGHTLNHWLNETFQRNLNTIAQGLSVHPDFFIIGKHLGYPAGLEFALKIKETSYIHAEAFAAGELKHGVISLVQQGVPCFILVNDDATRDEVLSSAAQLQARGGTIIGISPHASSDFNQYIKIPQLSELTVFPQVIVGQLLGYYLGLACGADPDKPRNLAKSVTVK